MISELPLFLFTTLVGLSVSTYAASAVAGTAKSDGRKAWLLTAACLALLCVGSLCVIGHLHHPERVFNALSNPLSSLTQEAYGAIAAGLLMFADLILSARKMSAASPVRIVGAVVSVVLVCVMAHAYFTVWGNAAWASWQTLPFFVVCDLAMGLALVCAVVEPLAKSKAAASTLTVLQVFSAGAMVLEGAQFAAAGFSSLPFGIACALSAAAAIAAAVSIAKPLRAKGLMIGAFALSFIAVVVARYAFYAVGLYIVS